jgi:hypothetical protein
LSGRNLWKPTFKIMEALKPKILELFKNFLSDKITKRELITELYKIEIELSDYEPTAKDLWFRFFRGDTLATTISDISATLMQNKRNIDFTKEQMQIAIENPNEFQIYFS